MAEYLDHTHIAQKLLDQQGEIIDLTAARDGAYRERAQLLAWLAALHPAVRTLALDVTELGWQILYLNPTTGGQMSWHIAPRDIELFEHVEYVRAGDERALWDGHTTEAKYERIASLTDFLAGLAETTDTPPCTCSFGARCATCRTEDAATTDDGEFDDEPADSDSDVLALISDIASRLEDATDEGEYHAAGLIGDLANGRKTVEEARAELADITFRHV